MLLKAPVSWRLEGRTKTSASWRTVDRQTDIIFAANETKVFDEKVSFTPYDYFRLKVLKVNGSDRLAIAEFQLFGCDKPLRSSLMDPGKRWYDECSVQYSSS